MRKTTQLMMLIIMHAMFFVSCKKDGIQQRDQTPSGTSQIPRSFIIKNLSWRYDSIGKKAFLEMQFPLNYSIDSISNVYRLFTFFNEWIKVSKDGTERDVFYYSIANGRLILYYIFEITDPNTDVQYLTTNLNGICNTVKIEFI